MTNRRQSGLLGLSIQQLTELVVGLSEPAYRARQLAQALYRERISELSAVSTLSLSLRERLAAEGYVAGMPRTDRRFQSSDGTVRYLFALADGQTVETVWMPDGDGGEAGDGSAAGEEELQSEAGHGRKRSRHPREAKAPLPATLCVSSQVGCAINCRFCMTAQLGAIRDLAAGEIVGQVLSVLNDHAVDLGAGRVNLVFMGQGEPLLNYQNFMQAVRLLVEEAGIAESRMTVSTSGIVPRIADLGREPIRPKLAISLNGSNDVIRERVMPINRKWNIAALMGAAKAFPLRPREKLTFEYVLLGGVNDASENAKELVRLLAPLRERCKVNLIALNPGPEIPFATPGPEQVTAFQQLLIAGGIPAFVRRPRGRDIYAACGQLRRTVELVNLQ